MKRLSLLLGAVLTLGWQIAAQNPQQVTITPVKLTDNIYMLMGQGGNIGVCFGEDGTFLIDDQFAPLTEKILAAIGELTDQPVRFVINTHWHGDHTGGNENLGKAGAIIVAHENVRKRLSTDQFMKAFNREVPAAPKAALPVITFSSDLKFHLNGEEIQVFHLPHAHTDGDAAIYFANSNVLHTGDLFFNGRYPFIDTGSGGNANGMIAAVEKLLARIDDQTQIIPGHGPKGSKADLEKYLSVLKTMRDRVAELVQAGKSLEEIIAAKPGADYDDTWGSGFVSADFFLTLLYESLQEK